MVKFLLLIDTISEYNKKIIDLGNTPLDVYSLCSIIRETFCLSYSIRKSNELYIVVKNGPFVLKFEGNNLKYLGSDERSQALLLLKGLERFKSSQNDFWEISTPGILIKKINSIMDFFLSIDKLTSRKIIITNEENSTNLKNIKDININEQDIIIIDSSGYPLETNHLNKVTTIALPNIIPLEDKILYINHQLDQQNG